MSEEVVGIVELGLRETELSQANGGIARPEFVACRERLLEDRPRPLNLRAPFGL